VLYILKCKYWNEYSADDSVSVLGSLSLNPSALVLPPARWLNSGKACYQMASDAQATSLAEAIAALKSLSANAPTQVAR
jgi:hypothetical protein